MTFCKGHKFGKIATLGKGQNFKLVTFFKGRKFEPKGHKFKLVTFRKSHKFVPKLVTFLNNSEILFLNVFEVSNNHLSCYFFYVIHVSDNRAKNSMLIAGLSFSTYFSRGFVQLVSFHHYQSSSSNIQHEYSSHSKYNWKKC